MDVSRIGSSGTIQFGKQARSTGAGEGFSQLVGSRPSSSAAVSGAGPTGALDALLAVQEAESATERRARARRRASDLLDGLDQIRGGLLNGQISPDRLDSLASMIAQRHDVTDDPALGALLDEIELRVHVELAKLDRTPPGIF